MYGRSEFDKDFNIYDFIEPEALCGGKYVEERLVDFEDSWYHQNWWAHISHKQVDNAKRDACGLSAALDKYQRSGKNGNKKWELNDIVLGPEVLPVGYIIGSAGTAISEEEYKGQMSAHQYGKTIVDYINDRREIDLLTMIQYGLKSGNLSTSDMSEEGLLPSESTCSKCSVESVRAYLDHSLTVILEAKVSAEVFLTYRQTARSRPRIKNSKQFFYIRMEFERPSGQLNLLNIQDEEGWEGYQDGKDDEGFPTWPLDQLLVPVVPYTQVEDFAEFVNSGIRSMQFGRVHEVFDLKDYTQDMPQYHRLSLDNSIGARIFYHNRTATCYDRGFPEEIAVKAGDVWIDMKALETYVSRWAQPDVRIMKWKSYVHEQIHWYTCWAYFKLMELMANKYQLAIAKEQLNFSLSYEFGTVRETAESSTPVAYMEQLAERCAPRLLMPAEAFRSRAEELIADQKKSGNDRISWSVIIDTLSRKFYTSKESTRVRLVELGYTDAMGAKNWVNNKRGFYCQEFLPSPHMDANHTYVISRGEALQEYRRNEKFRRLLREYPFAYVDGHYVVDSELYVERNKYGDAKLTEYALTHMDECCILFTVRSGGKEYADSFGVLNAAVKNGDRETSFTDADIRASLACQKAMIEHKKEVAAFVKKYQFASFAMVLEAMLQMTKVSAFQIVNRVGMSPHTLNNYRNGVSIPDGFTLLKMIIAMELKVGYRRFLFSRIQIDIKEMSLICPEMEIVDVILDTNEYRIDIEQWDEMIQEQYPEYYNSGFILDDITRKEVISSKKKSGDLSIAIQRLSA